MIFLLLIIFQVKHFLADFPLQTKFMLQKFKDKGWIVPLAAHAGVHAGFTFIISLITLWFTNGGFIFAAWCSIVDFIIHFTVDRIKASPHLLGRYEVLDKIRIETLIESKKNFLRVLKKRKDKKAIDEIKWIDQRMLGNKFFWWCIGGDQMLHHITHYLIIYILVSVR